MQTETKVQIKAQTSITEGEKTSFRLWLQRQFTERCKRNARYSLRAFAKSLDLDPSSLSQILSGKRPISKMMVKTICDQLGATPTELKNFGLVETKKIQDEDFLQMSLDTFSVISEWYHIAILELTYVTGFKSDARWISRKLSITVEEARAALDRLKRLGLLLEENGKLVKSSRFLTNHSHVNTSAAHKELQRSVISKALIAVDECHDDEKDITSMTMAIDEANLPKAKELIKNFRRDLCALLEEGEQKRVFNLGIQLYPISKNEKEIL